MIDIWKNAGSAPACYNRGHGPRPGTPADVMRLIPLLTFLAFLLPGPVRAADAASAEFFETKVRPVLAEHCYRCHSAKAEKLKGGLTLDSRAGVRKGGDGGPVV